ncbi:hypothetical protein [Streptomyces sp. RPT161]|uniref:hypothetical protein n=1 Tax=Streptomyces sp. RPT161 TaxID=3015993 RepID=UPI0022B86DAF|nr:hypothetical protein [Streptomyces sp. RPT161]
MAVKKIWTITHSCGHEVERDLSVRPADRRAGFAEWLAKQECTDCWKAARTDREEDRAAWLAAKRAEEQAAADAWSARYRMPPLEGTERGIAWGACCRHQLVSAAYTSLVLEGDMGDAAWQQIEDATRTITRAGWWIDNRASEPDDLPELLAAGTSSDRSCENPFL